jgi:hypothetical protein
MPSGNHHSSSRDLVNVSAIKKAHIPTEWMSLTRRLNTDELIALSKEVETRGVSPGNLTQVRAVFETIRLNPPAQQSPTRRPLRR